MKNKVIAFTKYSKLGASSRMRTYNYSKYLDGLLILPLFDDDYIKCLYSGERVKKIKVFWFYMRRFCQLLWVSLFSKRTIIWIEKELFPYVPFNLNYILKLRGNYLVYDYDDAVYVNYSNLALSCLFKKKFESIAKSSDIIFCGNPNIKGFFDAIGADETIILPTVIDIGKYDKFYKNKKTEAQESITIGWIGTPNTQKYLVLVDDAISKLQVKYPNKINFTLIGASKSLNLKSKVDLVNWSDETEAECISLFDIGIMPLPDSEFERGKSGYKIIQYMALGIPVLASPVGVNTVLVNNEENGYLCETEFDWIKNLDRLISDINHRNELGENGRKQIKSVYTYDANYQIICESFETLLQH
ncbi:glycosyltransferase family 4 protein [Vibrio breoganii]|uniref:glycosyltransferase family 4 protein n=1 Tax=Vibrio breoganii TaxID=553239 RepID=UPI00036A9A23|nr:glycosyltransferase family 4 protein [Vibrio breoganii]OED89073.1 hypothetical protein A1QE_07045 [Vibrio breoganii ZF-55]